MKQEDKNILLKDLCARIPYGVKGIIEGGDVVTTPLKWYAEQSLELSINYMVVKNGWRPYLLPLSSMTEEQKLEIKSLCDGTEIFDDGGWMSYISILGSFNFEINLAVVDWYNKNHFDYRGLIEKSLALDATNLRIYE